MTARKKIFATRDPYPGTIAIPPGWRLHGGRGGISLVPSGQPRGAPDRVRGDPPATIPPDISGGRRRNFPGDLITEGQTPAYRPLDRRRVADDFCGLLYRRGETPPGRGASASVRR